LIFARRCLNICHEIAEGSVIALTASDAARLGVHPEQRDFVA
jgi:hypothetical protein